MVALDVDAVAVPHRPLLNLIEASIDDFELTPDDVILWLSRPTVDVTMHDCFMALGSGAALAIPDRDDFVPQSILRSARALGATTSRILARHLVPNVVHLLIVRATLDVSTLVLAEATLSFIGIGVQPPHPSWGQMIYESFQYLDGHPLLLVFPAAALSTTVIAFNIVGEFLSRVLDPRYVARR